MNSLERLESRIAPALLMPTVSAKGVLLLQHDGTSMDGEDLLVTQTAPDKFTVVDTRPVTDTDFGEFTGVKSISVVFGNAGSIFDLKVSADGLQGTLMASATGGANAFTLQTANGTFGRIVGKVSVVGGAGDDQVNVTDGIAIASPVVFEGGTGMDSFQPTDAYLAKKLTLESVENITTMALEPVVIGGMLVENENADGAVIFVFNNVSTVTGSLTYCGSATVDDNVTLDGQVTGPALLMLLDGTNNVSTAGQYGGTLKITGGTGSDAVTFHRAQTDFGMPPAYVIANVAGALTMKLGDGSNSVTFMDNSYFAKGFSLTTGTGTDVVNLTEFIAAKNVTLSLGNGSNTVNGAPGSGSSGFVNGLLKYTGGQDADSLDLSNLVAGTLNVNVGNGANTVIGLVRVMGASAVFTAGSGVDMFSIGVSSPAAQLQVKLGAGDDTLTFLGGSLAKATVDGGAGTNDKLNNSAALPPAPNRKIIGFETIA